MSNVASQNSKRKRRKPRGSERRPKPQPQATSQSNGELTEQQCEILRGIVAGKTYKTIGEELGLTYETIKTYMKNLRKKLGLRTKVEMALWAQQNLGE